LISKAIIRTVADIHEFTSIGFEELEKIHAAVKYIYEAGGGVCAEKEGLGATG
jgi:hypothetical protein